MPCTLHPGYAEAQELCKVIKHKAPELEEDEIADHSGYDNVSKDTTPLSEVIKSVNENVSHNELSRTET